MSCQVFYVLVQFEVLCMLWFIRVQTFHMLLI